MSAQIGETFRDWAQASRGGLRQTAFLLSGDWYLADDLVQETLIRLYEAWPRISGTGTLRNYSRRVVINLYLDHRRRPARREHLTDVIPDQTQSDGPGLVHRDQLLIAMRQVPPGQRSVIVLRFWEDLSIEQTAQILDTSTGNVKSQTSRGLATLRAALTAAGLSDDFSLQEQP